MRFFAHLSVIATLAFSAFTSAVPAPEPPSLTTTIMRASEFEVRVAERSTPSSVPQLLAAATSQLQSAMDQLSALNSHTAKTPTITPILLEINNILNSLLSELKSLTGQPLDTILLSADGTLVLTVSEVAQLVSTLLFLVVNALFALLGTVNFNLVILGSDLNDVGLTLGSIVSQLVFLIDGLLFDLTPLVGSLLLTLDALVFSLLISVLGLL